MAVITVREIQELPAVLTMKDIQDVLGICKPKAYELAHTRGFPVVKIGRTFRVPKAAFLLWLEEQTGK
jgi:excisionase family DNA binding protein